MDHASETRSILHQHGHILFTIDREHFTRAMKIALRIRRAHPDLAFVIQITLRNPNRAGGFQDQIIFLLHLVGHQSIGDAARDDNVVFRAITQLAENRLERAAAMKDEDDFIGAAVLIILEFTVRFFRAARGKRSCPR